MGERQRHPFNAKYPGRCALCHQRFPEGERVVWWSQRHHTIAHFSCYREKEERERTGDICHYEECRNTVGSNGYYCSEHLYICMYGDCVSRIPTRGGYCSEHKAMMEEDKSEREEEEMSSATPDVPEVPPAPKPGSVTGGDDAGRVLATMVLPHILSNIPLASEERVKAYVQEIVSRPVYMTIPGLLENAELPPVRHHKFEEALYWLSRGKDLLLWGPSGSGKSFVAKQLADLLKKKYGFNSLAPDTPGSLLTGYMSATGDYVPSILYRAYIEGWLYGAEEVDNSSPETFVTMNSAFGNGLTGFPCGMVNRHPDFRVVATANTNGRGPTKMFPTRRELDGPFLDRFVSIYWPIDNRIEDAMVTAQYPEKAEVITSWIRLVRRRAEETEMVLHATPRAAEGIAIAMRDKVVDAATAAESLVWKGLSQEDRKTLKVPAFPGASA